MILNKKFFNKKKPNPSDNLTNIPKNLIQSEIIPDKQPISNEKKKPASNTNKLYASASPVALKSQKKEAISQNIKTTEEVLTHSEKLEAPQQENLPTKPNENQSNKIETSNKSDANKAEILKNDNLKESKKIESDNNTSVKSEVIKQQKSEEIEYIIKPTQKLMSTTTNSSLDKKKKNQPINKKPKKIMNSTKNVNERKQSKFSEFLI